MYLLSTVRGQGLGKYLLLKLEEAIASKGFQQIWIETASVLKEAVKLYESNGYKPTSGVETARCDRVYHSSAEYPIYVLICGNECCLRPLVKT